jgi:hypothetical protein
MKAQEETEAEGDDDGLKQFEEKTIASISETRQIQARVQQLLSEVRLLPFQSVILNALTPSSMDTAQSQPGGPEEQQAWDLIQTVKLGYHRRKLEDFYYSFREAVGKGATSRAG